MPEPKEQQPTGRHAHAEGGKHERLSPEQKHERKQRVLTQGTPSVVRSISDAIVAKDGDLFFLAMPDGNVPEGDGHGYGLYYHDCRYLNTYTLKIGGSDPSRLVATADRGYMSVFQLTNPDLRMKDGSLVPKEQLGIEWARLIEGERLALCDVITLQNFGLDDARFPLLLHFEALFQDVFAVRGLLREKMGKVHHPEWKDGAISITYDGTDGLHRSVSIYFSEEPHQHDGGDVQFDIKLGPREKKEIAVTICVAESQDEDAVEPREHYRPVHKEVESSLHESANRWLGKRTVVKSDSLLLNAIIERSLRDLRLLRSSLNKDDYFAAGLPWFGTLFGRDSLITSLQTLAYQPHIAGETLTLLAAYQGSQVDDYRDEQPGKILHELRVGEMARTGEIPHSPYYGTIDATMLFLVLMERHSAWTGDLDLFRQLCDNVERALRWMSDYGDLNHDGYIEYTSTSEKGLINQGWKDSGDAIVDADGSLAKPPIALVEVQGLIYMAKRSIASLFRRTGEPDRAAQLEKEAQELKERFNRDFWLEDKGFFALALQQDHKPAAVISSNPGQALWTGIVDDEKAKCVVERLMQDDMFTGWGIRTLSDRERRYNPVSYHLGTVWPHDNSLIAAGFRRHGFDDEARKLCQGIVDACMQFENYRLPELFAGFDRETYGVPVHYPVACHPQAWAAGSVPYMIETFLGLVPEGCDNALRVVRPILPDFVNSIELRGMSIGQGHVDLRFERQSPDHVGVKVLKADGNVDVQVES